MHLALENAIDIDEHITPAFQASADIYTRRVAQADAQLHQRVRVTALRDPFKLGELHLAVNPQDFPGVLRTDRLHWQPLFDGHPDDVIPEYEARFGLQSKKALRERRRKRKEANERALAELAAEQDQD